MSSILFLAALIARGDGRFRRTRCHVGPARISGMNADRISGTHTEIKVLKDAEVDRAIGDPNRAMAVKSTVAIIRSLDAQVVLLEKEVLRQTEPDQSFARLSAVSGIGDILAMTIVLETGDLKRFKGVGNYASYCRRVKSMRISNEKRKGANNRKNGNVYLAWAYGEAAMQAIRNNPTIKRYYERKRAKTDAPRAMNAVGHKLARAFFHVMRDGTAFDTERAFGRR
jgi:transposase